MKLCLALGIEHPDDLTMSSQQFADWVALYELDPWGTHRDDLRAAIQTSYGIAPYLKKGRRIPTHEEIMPLLNLGGKKRIVSIDEAKRMSAPERIRKQMRSAGW